ncbi:hypothetical protein CLV58_11774 [Spirosoma oryzae]|uniref:Uncharacterized protein n=1 Tax=Spirosoma oryzae TaxID=1469603 RepID=A0A2T0SM32_9BACT|nr:hypothetical protein CLV58_11774 [Spirosoma oryzae]
MRYGVYGIRFSVFGRVCSLDLQVRVPVRATTQAVANWSLRAHPDVDVQATHAPANYVRLTLNRILKTENYETATGSACLIDLETAQSPSMVIRPFSSNRSKPNW